MSHASQCFRTTPSCSLINFIAVCFLRLLSNNKWLIVWILLLPIWVIIIIINSEWLSHSWLTLTSLITAYCKHVYVTSPLHLYHEYLNLVYHTIHLLFNHHASMLFSRYVFGIYPTVQSRNLCFKICCAYKFAPSIIIQCHRKIPHGACTNIVISATAFTSTSLHIPWLLFQYSIQFVSLHSSHHRTSVHCNCKATRQVLHHGSPDHKG